MNILIKDRRHKAGMHWRSCSQSQIERETSHCCFEDDCKKEQEGRSKQPQSQEEVTPGDCWCVKVYIMGDHKYTDGGDQDSHGSRGRKPGRCRCPFSDEEGVCVHQPQSKYYGCMCVLQGIFSSVSARQTFETAGHIIWLWVFICPST